MTLDVLLRDTICRRLPLSRYIPWPTLHEEWPEERPPCLLVVHSAKYAAFAKGDFVFPAILNHRTDVHHPRWPCLGDVEENPVPAFELASHFSYFACLIADQWIWPRGEMGIQGAGKRSSNSSRNGSGVTLRRRLGHGILRHEGLKDREQPQVGLDSVCDCLTSRLYSLLRRGGS